METKEYENMYALEKDYWLYKGLHEIVIATLEKTTADKRPNRILDAGCGTGALLKDLTSRYGNVTGIDISDTALIYCAKRGLDNASKSSIELMPYQDDYFDVVLSIDVLCNLPQQALTDALAEIYRVLKKDGIFIFNVPAFNYLKSSHDRAVHIRQRFTKAQFNKYLNVAGFNNVNASYRNSILFFPIALIRLLKKRLYQKTLNPSSDTKPLVGWLNRALTVIIRFENKLLKAGLDFPFGLSLFGSVRKGS